MPPSKQKSPDHASNFPVIAVTPRSSNEHYTYHTLTCPRINPHVGAAIAGMPPRVILAFCEPPVRPALDSIARSRGKKPMSSEKMSRSTYLTRNVGDYPPAME